MRFEKSLNPDLIYILHNVATILESGLQMKESPVPKTSMTRIQEINRRTKSENIRAVGLSLTLCLSGCSSSLASSHRGHGSYGDKAALDTFTHKLKTDCYLNRLKKTIHAHIFFVELKVPSSTESVTYKHQPVVCKYQ